MTASYETAWLCLCRLTLADCANRAHTHINRQRQRRTNRQDRLPEITLLRFRPSSPLHMLILLLVVSVYPAGVLVVQLQALLAGRGFTVLRHHKNMLKNCQQPPYDRDHGQQARDGKTKKMRKETATPKDQWRNYRAKTPALKHEIQSSVP